MFICAGLYQSEDVSHICTIFLSLNFKFYSQNLENFIFIFNYYINILKFSINKTIPSVNIEA